MWIKHNPIGEEEINAVNKVLKSGVLSDFLGVDGDKFYGGKYVKELENDVCNYFDVKHAISVNSWTSGLICAVGSLNIEPGDEIITTPWTMCATATSIIHWNAIPVFADIDPKTFCISPESIRKCISKRTKAVLCVDIFGQSADYDAIRKIIPDEVKIICDTAQAPGAKRGDQYAGTLGDIGGFSFNYHKHIHTGEGGVIVTNDDNLAERCRLIRNHAEAIVLNRPDADLNNMIGFNFRMGEIEAAIAIEQLKKLNNIVQKRQKAASIIDKLLIKADLASKPFVDEKNSHVYYMYPLILNEGVNRDKVCKNLLKRNFKGLAKGYTNIHQLPIFQKKIAYGNSKIPWSLGDNNISYEKGICPVAENYHEHSVITLALNHYDLNEEDASSIGIILLDCLSQFCMQEEV
tara:strand:- start:60 stop:1277 length:1218 start_codon:yes stop_codon:yes gene_type:complete